MVVDPTVDDRRTLAVVAIAATSTAATAAVPVMSTASLLPPLCPLPRYVHVGAVFRWLDWTGPGHGV